MDELIKWLGKNCTPSLQEVNGVWDYYWCLNEDVRNKYDGIDDDTLKWYTNEQILEMFNKTHERPAI